MTLLAGAAWLCLALPGTGRADEKPAGPSDSELVRQLTGSGDKAERERAALALGDRAIAGTVELTKKDREALDRHVADAIRAAALPRDRNESELLVQRLWTLALPALLDGLDRNETYSFSVRMLTVLRDEAVVQAIVAKAQANKDPKRGGLFRFALSGMKGATRPRVPNRPTLDEKEAGRLYRETIEPALETLP